MEVESPLSPYITHEVQPFRRFLAKIFLAVPATITLAIGVQSGGHDTFEFDQSDRTLNERLDAYVPVMKESSWIVTDVANLPRQNSIRFGKIWADGWEQGKLKPLTMTSYSDSIYDGITGQVVRTHAAILFCLYNDVMEQKQKGNYDVAADSAFLAFRVSNALRYSDLSLQAVLNYRSHKALDFLSECAPKMSPDHRREIGRQLMKYRTDAHRLAQLTRGTYRMYLRDLDEVGADPNHLDRMPDVTPLEQVSPGEDATKALRKVREEMGDVGNQMPKRPFETVLAHTLEQEAKTATRLSQVAEKMTR